MHTSELKDLLKDIGQTGFIQIGLILLGAWLSIVLIHRAVPWLAEKVPARGRYWLLAMIPTLRLTVIVAAFFLILFRLIEPTFENLVTVFAALALAFGFAFRDYVSSLIAGVVTLGENPYRPGDWIKIGDAYGEVKSIGMRTVKIVTPEDTAVFIPHLVAWSQLIRNANDGTPYLQCAADFYLHPDHDGGLVKDRLHDLALTSAMVSLERPVTVVAQATLWATRYRLKAYPIDPRLQFEFITDLTVRGKAVLLDMGVTFATPPGPAPGRWTTQ